MKKCFAIWCEDYDISKSNHCDVESDLTECMCYEPEPKQEQNIMKTYLVSIMGKKGIFKKEVQAHHRIVDKDGYISFYQEEYSASAYCIIKEWILVEEVLEG